ncbi:hypothetical protein AHAS_Ahas11G0073600 [Arachis hypogaea]
MKLAKECCFMDIVIESDCMEVVNALKYGRLNPTCFGAFVVDALSLMCNFRFVISTHVKRSENKVAHELTKIGLTNPNTVWMEEAPNQVQNLAWLNIITLWNESFSFFQKKNRIY